MKRCGGFTLLEVMIALAIVAIALVGLLGLVQRSILAQEESGRITRATLLAQEKLARIEAGIDPAEAEGESFPPPDELYRWRVELAPAPVPGVRQIDVLVAWGDADRNQHVRLTSFVPEANR
ncbi:MAG: hypothetical protein Kow00100_16700 [Geothermobacteraceae bacterium]